MARTAAIVVLIRCDCTFGENTAIVGESDRTYNRNTHVFDTGDFLRDDKCDRTLSNPVGSKDRAIAVG
ncbi:MAG: hypothetical protein ACRC8A_05065 [Microcoleaceae cyanobacterium]